MIEKKRILAIVPARGGSKGIPRKNIRSLGGKPLIAWTLEAAQKSKYLDRIIISSEDPEILQVAKKLGFDVPFTRPMELATDDAPGIAPVLHALEQLSDFDAVVLLQPTSPLRTAADIDGTLEYWMSNKAPSCVSISEVSHPHPYWSFLRSPKGTLQPLFPEGLKITRRQDLPPVFVPNGAVYVAQSSFLKENKTFITEATVGYLMPSERALDLDTAKDWSFAEFLLANNIEL